MYFPWLPEESGGSGCDGAHPAVCRARDCADLAEADVILVNTCGFIESAKTEAIENILEACAYKQQNPNLKVIVTGCLAERYRSQIEEEIPEVDAVVAAPPTRPLIPSWSGCSTARIIWKATAPKRTSRWAASASSARPPTMLLKDRRGLQQTAATTAPSRHPRPAAQPRYGRLRCRSPLAGR